MLQVLRERLRCKEIWVVGANRYRNPDEDLPTDFEVQREQYYAALNLPQDVESFLGGVQREMNEALTLLDRSLPKNPHIKILQKGHGWIALSPLNAQPEPVNLSQLKSEILKRWPMTSLLDMLKETDLRTGFSKAFKSATGYGLGTNTGLKRVSSGAGAESYSDLVYVRRRFIRKEPFREAIAKVVNAVFRVRLPHIWGEATTACASDSKKFGAWDQNLMTEWHVRYGGKRHHDLLACREACGLHLLPVENLFLVRSRGHDRRLAPPCYRDGGRQKLRRFAWTKRGGFRLLPPARLSAFAKAQSYPCTEAVSR